MKTSESVATARSATDRGEGSPEVAPTRQRAFRLKALEPSEADVQASIRQLLAVHPRVAWHGRINSGKAWLPSGKVGKFRPVQFHDVPGMSDLLGQLVDGRLLAIEVKRPSWRQPTDERERLQQAFLTRVCDAGGLGFFARSLEDVLVMLGPMR